MRMKNYAALLGLLMLSTAPRAEEVNLYNWYDYLPPEAITEFEQRHGIKVNYDVFDSNEILEAKLVTGNSGYDVVVPSGSFLERQSGSGLYQKIDKSRLPNYANLDHELLAKVAEFDPDNAYGVPYAWGTVGIGYNAKMLKERLGEGPYDSLKLLFDPEYTAKLQDCGIALIDSPSEVMSVALNYVGLDPNSERREDLKAASKLLKAVRKDYKYFHSANYIPDLASGEICVALGYSGGVIQSQAKASGAAGDIEVGYSIPNEGTLIWFDMMAIPADSPNPSNAHTFINYILEPEVGASISNLVYYAVPNVPAGQFIDKGVFENRAIYPDADVKSRLFVLKAHSKKYDRSLNREWSNIKAQR